MNIQDINSKKKLDAIANNWYNRILTLSLIMNNQELDSGYRMRANRLWKEMIFRMDFVSKRYNKLGFNLPTKFEKKNLIALSSKFREL
ncbi:hypothetical protein [uncultured Winogradskyella sp.]|uniref:hypothetical protein n=1 Tax=uncultured Winogradskyella sp. TaxID=395353 RepID=UPI002607BEBF|nr:hypothetical protein [uncultured Winogradskyella sp.]